MATIQLLIFSLCTCLFWLATAGIRYRYKSRQLGCEPATPYPQLDRIFGLDYMIFGMREVFTNSSVTSLARRLEANQRCYQTHTLGQQTIFSSLSEHVQTVYRDRKDDWGIAPVRHGSMEPFCGSAFLSTDGTDWENSRDLFKPAFAKSSVEDLEEYGRSVDRFLSILPKSQEPVDLQPLLYRLFFDASTNFLFGRSLDAASDAELGATGISAKQFLAAFHSSLMGVGLKVLAGRLSFLIPKMLFARFFRTVHRLIDFYIEETLTETSATDGSPQTKGSRSRSLLRGLAERSMDRVDIRNQIIQGMMASQDTTSVLISNTLFLLARSPGTWAKIRSEVKEIGASGLTPDYLNSSRLLRNTMNESLRLFPVFTNLTRAAIRDTVLPTGGGLQKTSRILVPVGTKITFSFFHMHRDETIFGNRVEEFDPERWNSIKTGPFDFLPFGRGARMCLGQHKAMIEAQYLLARMAQKFEKMETADSSPWIEDEKLSTRNANGCKVVLFLDANAN